MIDFLFSLNDENFKRVIGQPRQAIKALIAKRMQYLASIFRTKAYKLSPEEEVLLIFLHLRHYIIDDLCALFLLVSHEVVTITRERVLPWFYDLVQHQINVGTIEERLSSGVTILDTLFTFILDGSEQFVFGSSSSVFTDTRFFSGKKDNHSINKLIVIDMNGKILWMSASFPGSNNDHAVVIKELKKFLAQISPSEHGIGDQGFKGLFAEFRIAATPKRGNELFRVMSHWRVRVENKFEDIKNWRCTRDELRIPPSKEAKILKVHDQYWTIIGVIVDDKEWYLKL